MEPKKEQRGDERKNVQAVERALTILETLAHYKVPMTITDLSEQVNLKVSTVHRLLGTLMAMGFVNQDKETSKYKLGLKTLQFANAALYGLDIRTVARPYLNELVERCNETANLSILDKGELVYIDQVESKNVLIVKMFARIGSRGPAHCTASGKVLLAALTEPELSEILKEPLEQFTNETITNLQYLRKELERIRTNGYALDLEEKDEGVRCVGVPVRNHEGKTVAAVSVVGPATRLTNYYLNNELIDIIKDIGRKISAELGFVEE